MVEQLACYQQLSPWGRAILLFPLGLVVGSFSSVILHRRPRGLSVAVPRSRCPACGHTLGATELIPLVSFVWQRGRCRGCGQCIPWRYPLLELGSGLLASAVGAAFGWVAGSAALLVWVSGALLISMRMPRAKRGEAGSTLVEVLAAVALLSVLLLLMAGFGQLVRGNAQFVRQVAVDLARNQVENMIASPRESTETRYYMLGQYRFRVRSVSQSYVPPPGDPVADYSSVLMECTVTVTCFSGCKVPMPEVKEVALIAWL